MPRAPGDADALVVRALELTAQGDLAEALATWYTARPEGSARPDLLARARVVLSCVEGKGPRDRVPPRAPLDEPASEAWACAWAGDLECARQLAEEAPDDPASLGVLGAVHMLQRRSGTAVALLDEGLARGGGQALALLRVRALVHLGRLAEAHGVLLALGDGESFARRVLIALVDVKRLRRIPAFAFLYRRLAASQTYLNALFSTELPAVVSLAELDRALSSGELATLLDNLLDRMAGNLGPSPTLAEVAHDGSRRYVRLELPSTGRSDAVAALHSLPCVGAARTEASLLALIERRPRCVHARCYLGELYLWLGRYDEAWDAFLAARRVHPARWTAIGMVAVLALTDRRWPARLMASYAEHRFSRIPGATLPVYRGLMRRRSGDFEGAILDLQDAITAKPTRVGARIELCLALRAAGRAIAASEHARVLVREAAPLLVDVAKRLNLDWAADRSLLVGNAVFEEALRAMRGNRSSSLVTWIDGAGTLRVLEPVALVQSEARGALASLEC